MTGTRRIRLSACESKGDGETAGWQFAAGTSTCGLSGMRLVTDVQVCFVVGAVDVPVSEELLLREVKASSCMQALGCDAADADAWCFSVWERLGRGSGVEG